MERTAKSLLSSTAYPLKAVRNSAVNNHKPDSPYLRALLAGTAKQTVKPGGSVFSLINSAPSGKSRVRPDANKLPKDIELTEKEWFNNYE